MCFLPQRVFIRGIMMMLLALQATAQKPLKVNLSTYFDELIIPPSTAREAYQKTRCSPDAPNACNADVFYTRVRATLDNFQKELTMPAQTGGIVKQVQNPELLKKMKSINPEEKMKSTMEMTEIMQTPAPLTAESPGVTSTMEDIGKINTELGNEEIRREGLAKAEL